MHLQQIRLFALPQHVLVVFFRRTLQMQEPGLQKPRLVAQFVEIVHERQELHLCLCFFDVAQQTLAMQKTQQGSQIRRIALRSIFEGLQRLLHHDVRAATAATVTVVVAAGAVELCAGFLQQRHFTQGAEDLCFVLVRGRVEGVVLVSRGGARGRVVVFSTEFQGTFEQATAELQGTRMATCETREEQGCLCTERVRTRLLLAQTVVDVLEFLDGVVRHTLLSVCVHCDHLMRMQQREFVPSEYTLWNGG